MLPGRTGTPLFPEFRKFIRSPPKNLFRPWNGYQLGSARTSHVLVSDCLQPNPTAVKQFVNFLGKWFGRCGELSAGLLGGRQHGLQTEGFVYEHVLADCFAHLAGRRPQAKSSLGGPRLRICFRIVDRHIQVQSVLRNTPEALHKMQSVTVRVAHPIEPRSIVNSDGVDYKRLSLPFANRVPHPQGLQVLWMLATIRVNLPHIAPPNKERAARHLNDLERSLNRCIDARHSGWKTAVGQVVRIFIWDGSERGLVGLEFFHGPRSHGRLVRNKGIVVPRDSGGHAYSPNSRQVLRREARLVPCRV